MIRRHDFDYDRLCNYTTLHPHPHLHFSPNVSILRLHLCHLSNPLDYNLPLLSTLR